MNIYSTIPLNSGNRMPVMGLGTWQLNDHTAEVIAEAIRLGYQMIDTSGDYGTQPGVGQGIKASGVQRGKIYVVTKVEETDNAYEATLNNLEELQLEYADLVLIHHPPQSSAGQELWEGLIQAKEEGLTKDIGVSNYSEEQIEELNYRTSETPVVNQIEWTPFGHSQAMLNYCRQNNIVIQAYSPLARHQRQDDETLQELSAKYHKTPAQILIRWNLQLGTVPLPKANSTRHLKENLEVFDFELSDDDMAMLAELNEEYSALGALPYV